MIKPSIAGLWCALLSLYLSFKFLIGNEQAIAAHTFCVLVLRWRGPEYISKVVVLMIWGFTALVVGVPYHFHRNERYYGEAGYCKSLYFSFCSLLSYQFDVQGCFVRQGFVTEQLVTEYLWVWGAAFLMAILYFTMFVVMRGWFIVDNGVYWYKTYRRMYGNVQPVEETQDEKDSKAIANLML